MDQRDFQAIELQNDHGVLTITLNRPETLNALDHVMERELELVLREADEDPGVKVLVIRGKGRAFCAGGDVANMLKSLPRDLAPVREEMKRLRRVVLLMSELAKPIICGVNGVAAGGGASIPLAADLVVAAENAKFVFSFVKVALVPDMGSMFLLPQAVGLLKAKELMLLGEPVDAREAERIGLVNKVVPLAELDAYVEKWARRLADGPALAMEMIKQGINKGLNSSLEEILSFEVQAESILSQTKDHEEGVRAFVEKRPPQFRGL